MSIILPKPFSEKLDGIHQTIVNQYIATYTPILQNNKLVFFPDFTDHGVNHINQVLQTAANIIPEKSYNYIDSIDISAIIISVILHDVGMHLDVSGLKKLLSGEFDQYKIDHFDSKSWNEEWEDFFYEAKRFNGEQMRNIFGSSEIGIREPNLDELDSYTIKLYGEFLRRHHHRLAHEIAIGGFPTKPNEENLKVGIDIQSIKVIDLCGVIARSHGMNLRDTFEYLKEQHDEIWNVPFDVKIVYLMVILRISDYLQIQSDRASDILIRTKLFSSPISIQEWQKHNSIEHISVKNADPERIYVQATPLNSRIYLELIQLFNNIQKEFDLSWAILGEVYGKDNELSKLKIKYRRIVSNIDNKDKFSKNVNYLPEKVLFDADPELLKLLIGPLYGDDPKYGIRELLQNSVDAVKERIHISGYIDNPIEISLVLKEKNSFTLIIKDFGIGMTSDTIINFFFRAGASYRESMIWKKNFIKDDIVQVEKTGRFGVGALAVFLLGNEFELTTRNIHDTHGYRCNASLDSTQIELLKCNADIGTTIKINLKDDVNTMLFGYIDRLKEFEFENYGYNIEDLTLDWFSWYAMNEPKIKYFFPNENIQKIFNFPVLETSSDPDVPFKTWRKFKTNDFRSIHWTIENYRRYDNHFPHRSNGLLLCNGFLISRGYDIDFLPWRNPIVSVFDGEAKMPISLSRDHIQNDRLPFEKELIKNICETIINQFIQTKFEKIGDYWVAKENILNLESPIDLSQFVVVNKDHFSILDSSIFKLKNINQFYQLWLKKTKPNSVFLNDDFFYCARFLDRDTNYFYKATLEEDHYKNTPLRIWFNLGNILYFDSPEVYNFIPNGKLQFMLEKNRLSKSFKYLGSNFFNDNWSYVVDFGVRTNEYSVISSKEIESKLQSFRRRKSSDKLVTDIDPAKLKFEDFHLIKQIVLDLEKSNYFEIFVSTFKEIVGENCMIPIQNAEIT